MENKITVIEDMKLDRIDNFLSEKLDLSRSIVQKMLKKKEVLVNDQAVKNSYKVKLNDIITYCEYKEPELKVEPENIKLDIVYEDEDLLVINKPNKMVVHPAIGNNSGTLVNGLVYYSKSLSDINGEFRPGIVHRIDAYTTGLLMVAKNNKAHEFLAEQLKNKTTHRKYYALVWGRLKSDTATIDAPIGRSQKDRKKMAVTSINSKNAVTHIKTIERFEKATLVEVTLETGRTHQIRVHMEYIGHPVVNDSVYGRRQKVNDEGQCLHAKELGFVHPTTGKYVEFDSELPEKFLHILNEFKQD